MKSKYRPPNCGKSGADKSATFKRIGRRCRLFACSRLASAIERRLKSIATISASGCARRIRNASSPVPQPAMRIFWKFVERLQTARIQGGGTSDQAPLDLKVEG